MRHLLYSLFLDNSSTVCTLGVTLIVKLLPFFAVHAREDLKEMLPTLLAVLARIMCWKKRRASRGHLPSGDSIDEGFERELELETNPVLRINSDIKWERLEMTFNATTSLPPSSRPYFTILYYLYPSNILKFLRDPVQYLENSEVRSPYAESWKETFDRDEIRRRSEVRLSYLRRNGTNGDYRTWFVNTIAIPLLFGVMQSSNSPNPSSGPNMTSRAS